MAMAGQAFDSPHGRLATLADVLCGWQRRRNGGGSSTHCFEPRVMLAALKLHSQVRRRVDMRELILLCLDIVHTEPVKLELQRRLASGDVAVPGYKACSEACMKLDLLAMQWARHQSSRWCVKRYVLIDASPQRGWNYLVSRRCQHSEQKLFHVACHSLTHSQK